MMKIEHLHNQQWYLAQYNTTGNSREQLFNWLSHHHMVPWTPLISTRVQRADKPHVYRRRVVAIFPGYFFLKANFDAPDNSITTIRRHPGFCGFVLVSGAIKPVQPRLVDALMKTYPAPEYHPAAREEISAAADTWLTRQQYELLMTLENTEQSLSKISMLYKLAFQADRTVFA